MAKTPQLVSQYLENISRDALERYQQLVRQYVRHRDGVYALYRHGKLYYVGLATDLRWRLRQHLKDRHEQSWDRFSVYLTINVHHLRELESLLLRVIKPKPPGNQQLGKFGKAENLVHQFRRALKALQKQELAVLLGRDPLIPAKLARPRNGRGRAALRSYVTARMALRARYKKDLVRATLRRDGMIRLRGKLFKSPSQAAAAITGHATSGWWFWKYERAPGEWVRLRELRR